jgi:ribosome-associated toxin RatA of RatAB toxin-antitoxin module
MRAVRLVFIAPDRSVTDVYATLADFARYPELSPAVRRVSVSEVDGGTAISTWEVSFRKGILRWTEEDVFDPVAHQIRFRQLEGDVADFEGSWACTAGGSEVKIVFEARVDLGIPSLADALEPIATRTLIANTSAIVTGLLGAAVRLVETDDVATPVAASIGRPAHVARSA